MRQGGHRILCEMISQLQVISAQVIKTKNNQDTFDATAPTRNFHPPIIKPSGGS
jgi:hypothetical protein